MKRAVILIIICMMLVSAMTAAALQTAWSAGSADIEAVNVPAPTTALTLARMEICANVINRTPVDVASSFPATQDKVYCYLEFKEVKEETSVTVVWTLGQNVLARVPLTITPSARFRTWSSKTIYGLMGDWKVDVVDDEGTILKSATFTIQ